MPNEIRLASARFGKNLMGPPSYGSCLRPDGGESYLRIRIVTLFVTESQRYLFVDV